MNYETLVVSTLAPTRVGVRQQQHGADIPADTHVAQSVIEKRERPTIARGSKFFMLAATHLAATACGGTSSPVTPTPVVVVAPLCQTRNTAEITFGNTSLNSTYSVVFDGVSRVTLAPGQTSQVYTEAAGVQHKVDFKYSNSSLLACNTSTPVWAQCTNQTISCKF